MFIIIISVRPEIIEMNVTSGRKLAMGNSDVLRLIFPVGSYGQYKERKQMTRGV